MRKQLRILVRGTKYENSWFLSVLILGSGQATDSISVSVPKMPRYRFIEALIRRGTASVTTFVIAENAPNSSLQVCQVCIFLTSERDPLDQWKRHSLVLTKTLYAPINQAQSDATPVLLRIARRFIIKLSVSD